MDVTLPIVPTGITALLAFLSPYAVAIVNDPIWPAKYKKLVTLVVTLVLAAAALWLFYAQTGYVFPNVPQFLLMFLLISQAAYALVLKPSAKQLESFLGTGAKNGKHEAL